MWYTKFCHNHTAGCNELPTSTGESITYTPPSDVSAALSAGQRYTGTIATYNCLPGYQMVGGSSQRACGPDGTWNGTQLSCCKHAKIIQTQNGIIDVLLY